MPVSTVLVLIAVVAVFALFATALAWAQTRTRQFAISAPMVGTESPPKRRPF